VDRRSGCNIPAAFLPRASSARARRTPDSNIAPSILEAAFYLLARKVWAASKKGELHAASPGKKINAPVKLAGLCADASSVSRKMSAISSGPLPAQISSGNGSHRRQIWKSMKLT
jgi:hypothetical protein